MSSFCTKCGNKNLNSSAKFCSKCGLALVSKSQINTNLEINNNLSHINSTLFIIPKHFKNNLEALLKKYKVQSKGIVIISNSTTAFQDTKEFICSINNLTYICIIGTWSEIPPHKVENPASSDHDKFCYNDSLYGSVAENKTDILESIPEILVGRIPFTDLSVVENIIFKQYNLKKFDETFLFSVSAQCWIEASKKIFSNLMNQHPKDYDLSLSNNTFKDLSKGGFFNSPDWNEKNLKRYLNNKIRIKNALIMFNVHGGADTTEWVGEGNNKDYVEIFKPNTIADYNYSILLTEACYGGAMDYNEQSIVENFFQNNGLCFVGSSTIAYGSPTENICAADNIAKYFFENINKGDCAGLALSKAKIEVLKEDPVQSDISFKTVLSFNLFGPPWIKKEVNSNSEGILNRVRNANRENFQSSSILLNQMRNQYRARIPIKIRQFLIENDKKIEQIHKFKDYDLIKDTITNYGFELDKSIVKYIENSKGKGYEIKLSEKYLNNVDKNLLIFTDIDGRVINVIISK